MQLSEIFIANHIKLDRFQVSSHHIHGKICKRGKPFNLVKTLPKGSFWAHLKITASAWNQTTENTLQDKILRRQKKKPQAPDSDCFCVHWNQKLKTKSTGWKKTNPDRSKLEKMFSQIFVKWNYPISQSFTCKQKWWALRTVLRMNWKLYQVAATVTLCFPAFTVSSSMPLLFFFLFQLSEYIFIENMMFWTKMSLGCKPRPYFAGPKWKKRHFFWKPITLGICIFNL